MAYGSGRVNTRKKTKSVGAKRKMKSGALIRAGAGNKPVKNAVKKVTKKIKTVVSNVKKKAATKKANKNKVGSSKNPRFL